MQFNFKDLLKEQIIFLILPVIVLIALFWGVFSTGIMLTKTSSNLITQRQQVKKLEKSREDLAKKVAQRHVEGKEPDMKQILELESLKFGVDASFAPLFDNMINVAKESGIRIRSVEYNYSPSDDPIFAAKVLNHNVCQLDMTIVGKYSEIQTFLKAMVSSDYLVNIAQLEIVSWRRDKSVLIANVKMNFYTKTK